MDKKLICGGLILIFVIILIIGATSHTGTDTTNKRNKTFINDFKVPSDFEEGELDGVWVSEFGNGIVITDYEKHYDSCKAYLNDDRTYSVHKTDKENIYYGLDTVGGTVYVIYFELVEKDGHKLFISCDGYSRESTEGAAAFAYLQEFNQLNNLKPVKLWDIKP